MTQPGGAPQTAVGLALALGTVGLWAPGGVCKDTALCSPFLQTECEILNFPLNFPFYIGQVHSCRVSQDGILESLFKTLWASGAL